MTTHWPWLPKSHAVQTLARRFVNRCCPQLRNYLPLCGLDGPLPSPDVRTSASAVAPLPLPCAPDPFAYLECTDDPRTRRALLAEQRHYGLFAARRNLKQITGTIHGELDSRALVTTREDGFDKGEERIGEYIYFTRTIDDNDDSIGFYRKRPGEVDLFAEELINPVALQQRFGYAHCTVGLCRVSHDGRYLAYTLSIEGGDRYICHVRSLDSDALYHVIRGGNIVSVEFGARDTLFYTESNELNRPCCVMLQLLRPGVLPPAREVYRDDDERFFVDVRRTKDGAFVVFTSDAKLHGSAHVVPATYPHIPHALQPVYSMLDARSGLAKPLQLTNRDAGWNWLEHYDGHFLLATSDRGPNLRLVYARVEVALAAAAEAALDAAVTRATTRSAEDEKVVLPWRELLPHRADVRITDVDVFAHRIVVYETHFAFERRDHIRIIRCDDDKDNDKDNDKKANGDGGRRVTALCALDAAAARSRDEDVVLHFPPMTTVLPGLNHNYVQDSLSFVYSSVVQPPCECAFRFDSDVTAQQARTRLPSELYTHWQAEHYLPMDYMWPYIMYRDVCVSADGTHVPLTICQQRDTYVQEMTDFEPRANRPRHCLVYVYGAYGEVPAMHFQLAPYLWLLRRRWIVVFAHVRGGGELPTWEADGRGAANKARTIDDFIACCEHVVAAGYTTPQLMVAAGQSAGCMPIAAAMNRRGDGLFAFALLRAPFVDIVGTMRNTQLPLALAERADWGDVAHSRDDLAHVLRYDPYHNINDRVTYPGMLVSACLDDERVPAWVAAKYVAKLRQQRYRTGVDPVQRPLLLRLRAHGGHYCWNNTHELCEELAWLGSQLDVCGLGQVTDVDMMTQLHNYAAHGYIDQDDAETTRLKWDAWERERVDYMHKLHTTTWEANVRKLRAEKSPFSWVPDASELDQDAVDAMLRERERVARERARASSGGPARPGDTGTPVGRNLYKQQQQQQQKQ